MALQIKARKIGNSVGAVLLKEALVHLNANEGDSLLLTETADGFHVTSSDPEFMKTMSVFEDLSRRYRNTLRELAK